MTNVEDDEDNIFALTTSLLSQYEDSCKCSTVQDNQAITKRSCVNVKVRWLMFNVIQPQLQKDEEITAARWILSYCHKQLPYDRNWWSRMERQNGELSMDHPEVGIQIEMMNSILINYIRQLLNATTIIKIYINGIDPMTNTRRKRDWNASASLSEWISGDRGLLMKKLAINEPEVKPLKDYLPECLCEENLKEALHNGGILVKSDSNRNKKSDEDNQPIKQQLNLVKPGAADTRMLDITLSDGCTLTVRRSRCSLNIPTMFVTDPVVIPKICVYDFGNGLNLYIFYRGHKMGNKKRQYPTTRNLNYFQNQMPRLAKTGVDDEDCNNEDSNHTTAKRHCRETDHLTTKLPSVDGYEKILPGVNVPQSIKQQFDTKQKNNQSCEEKNNQSCEEKNPFCIEIRRRRNGTTFDHQCSNTQIGTSIIQNELTIEGTDKAACTSVPIQTVLNGTDGSIVLFTGTLKIRIELENSNYDSNESIDDLLKTIIKSEGTEQLEQACRNWCTSINRNQPIKNEESMLERTTTATPVLQQGTLFNIGDIKKEEEAPIKKQTNDITEIPMRNIKVELVNISALKAYQTD